MAAIDNYEELNAAITKESGQPIVTKFLILAECIDEDGDRVMMRISSEACLLWDQLGMLEFHRQWLSQP